METKLGEGLSLVSVITGTSRSLSTIAGSIRRLDLLLRPLWLALLVGLTVE